MKDNPFLEVHGRKGYHTGEKALTEGNVNTLLEHITDLEHLGLIQLGIAAGIRRSDIVRIKKQDVNFGDNSVTFYEQKKRRTHKVYIPQTVANTLKMIIKINKRQGNPYLFVGQSESKYNKGHMSDRNAYNILNKYLKKAGLDFRPFHALRATCIKLCQRKGWEPAQTAAHVGDTIRVIQEHYSVPSNDEMKETANNKALI